MKHIAEKIAKKFADVLASWLSSEEIAEFLQRTKDEKDSSICHSHDYCDANMAMLEAFKFYGLNLVDGKDETFALCNEAWSLAKKHLFYRSA